MIHAKYDEPMDEQITDFLVPSSHFIFLNVCVYCHSEHNFQNAIHSVVFYYMFRPFWPSSGRFSNVHGKEQRSGGFPFSANTL